MEKETLGGREDSEGNWVSVVSIPNREVSGGKSLDRSSSQDPE